MAIKPIKYLRYFCATDCPTTTASHLQPHDQYHHLFVVLVFAIITFCLLYM